MGTHSALVIRTHHKTYRYERTMDGQDIITDFLRWANDPDTIPSPYDIGGGSLQIGLAGEGNQEYSLIIDIPNKRYAIDWPVDNTGFQAMLNLYNKGWTILEYKGNEDLQDVLCCPNSIPAEGSDGAPYTHDI